MQQMECPEVFYTYEWALAVSRAYHASIRPLLFLAYERDSLVGFVALARNSAQREAFFLAGTTADYCDFVSHPERRRELVSGVLAELRLLEMPTLVLANLPADSATASELELSAHTRGYSLFFRPAYRCARVVIASPEQKEAVRQSVQRKQMVRRQLKAMSNIGTVTVRNLRSWEEIAAVLPAFERAHVARFLARGQVSNLVQPERPAFLGELAKLLSEAGWMTLSCLEIDNEKVAWNYGFQFAGSWFWYQPAFDRSFERYYPGFCLLAKIVEQASAMPEINRIDLGLGDEVYKERFATGARHTIHVTVTTSAARYLKENVRYQAASAIKHSPALEHCVRKLLGRPSPGGAQV